MDNAYWRRPWSIRGGHLVLKPWNPSLTWQEIPFTSSAFWVQVHGLPDLWRSLNNLWLLEGKAGNVIVVDLDGEGGGSWKRFIRIQVEIELNRPLIPSIFLPRHNLPHLWISLIYEKLVDVCYRCGIIGHESYTCQGKIFFIRNPFCHEFIGSRPWLRAENYTTLLELFLRPSYPTQPVSTNGASCDTVEPQTVLLAH